jgi:hypothetical protein
MARNHRSSRSHTGKVRSILIALAIAIGFLLLNLPAYRLCNVVSVVTEHALVLLPAFVLAALQALRSDVFLQQHISDCALDILLFWPLLQTAAKAA